MLSIRIRIGPSYFETGSGSASKSNAGSESAKEGRGRSQWRPGGSKRSRGESVDHLSQIFITLMRSRIRIRIKGKVGYGSASKCKEGSGSASWCFGSATLKKLQSRAKTIHVNYKESLRSRQFLSTKGVLRLKGPGFLMKFLFKAALLLTVVAHSYSYPNLV